MNIRKVATIFVLVTVMSLGSSRVFAQVKIGTNPAAIEANSNLEVEASGPGSHKVKVDKVTGQVTIKDGTEGKGKVFTSDENGGGSWQTQASNLVLLSQVIGETLPVAFAIEKKLNVKPTHGTKVADWDAVNRKLVITKAGIYQVTGSIGFQGTSKTESGCLLILRGGTGAVDTFTASSEYISSRSLSTIAFCPVGTEITLSFQINSGAPVTVSSGNLTVQEIP